METLDLKALAKGNATWQLFHLPDKTPLSHRSSAFVAPINPEEIAILGGRDNKGNDLSDVVLYNIKTRGATKLSDQGPFKFHAGKT